VELSLLSEQDDGKARPTESQSQVLAVRGVTYGKSNCLHSVNHTRATIFNWLPEQDCTYSDGYTGGKCRGWLHTAAHGDIKSSLNSYDTHRAASRATDLPRSTAYPETLPYEVDYDPALWQLIEDFDNNPQTLHDERLQFSQDTNCSIALFGGPMERIYIGSVELAGRRWALAPRSVTIEKDETKSQLSFLVYTTDAVDPVAGNIAYFLMIYLPMPHDPAQKSICQKQAEAVISTFRIVDATLVTPLPIFTPEATLTAFCTPGEFRYSCLDRLASQQLTPAPVTGVITFSAPALTEEAAFNTRAAEYTPPPTPLPATATPWSSPLTLPSTQTGEVLFEARSVYQEIPRFRVTYSSTEWQLQETSLKHTQLPNCTFALTAGAEGTEGPMQEEARSLGERTWRSVFFPVAGKISYYWADDERRIGYLFAVLVPPNAAAEVVDPCRAAAEVVLSTFTLVEP